MKFLSATLALLCLSVLPLFAHGSEVTQTLDLTRTWTGYFAIAIFILAYLAVMTEELTELRKSKPVLLAAGAIWIMIAWAYVQQDMPGIVEDAAKHNILEYAELFLFLLVAMTYINSMEERQVFETLRARLVKAQFTYKQLFWITGLLAFFISPIADNLTTALLMCAVVLAVGRDSRTFVPIACVNIVVAANAGGAFSPFGDITTLMVWHRGHVTFGEFLMLFVPSVVNWGVPALIMSFFIPHARPALVDEHVNMLRGARRIVVLFLLTIATAVIFENVLHLPATMGMMMGLAYLKLFGYFLKTTFGKERRLPLSRFMHRAAIGRPPDERRSRAGPIGDVKFDIFQKVGRAEWDTLLFFYGVIMCVGGLGLIGYLHVASEIMYGQWGATTANVVVGVLSALVDNIPIMFAVLTMEPDMSLGQWLLVTLTAGVGGSMLSIGSAAGVALMGQARGHYTFMTHLKWTPVIALGYGASILVHMWLNHSTF
ncbi:MAG: sodium:proton antiporter NhaD [Proteobacteria bacterium]|jgi:NhaD family Na+/H+ antiporter|nr:sodium:proton antiporter NhaD [Pseudomonadota bacterium]MDA1301941.1 sodium:proton antiporter NhaD [Pseudomonadota bacterium]